MLKQPFSTRYVKWRHKERHYRVEVLNINSSQLGTGYYSQLLVRRLDNGRTQTWSAEVFVRTFKPSGKKTPLDDTEGFI